MRPNEGIAVDAAHSMKRGITEFQAIDLKTGDRLFYKNLGNQTVNIGEFLGVVEAAKYIVANNFTPRVIYTDSVTAMAWYRDRKATTCKPSKELEKAIVYLKACSKWLKASLS